MMDVLRKDRRGEDAQRRKPCEEEAESGVMQPQAKDCRQLPGARGAAQNGFSLRASRRNRLCRYLDFSGAFWLPECERINVCCFKPCRQLMVIFTAALGNKYILHSISPATYQRFHYLYSLLREESLLIIVCLLPCLWHRKCAPQRHYLPPPASNGNSQSFPHWALWCIPYCLWSPPSFFTTHFSQAFHDTSYPWSTSYFLVVPSRSLQCTCFLS